MPPNQEIAGLSFKLINHIQYDKKEFPISEIGSNPVIKIEKDDPINTYTVTIGTYLPINIIAMDSTPLSSFEVLNSLIYIKYSGITNIKTDIPTTNINNTITCRDFNLIYKYIPTGSNLENFRFHLITFRYSFLEINTLEAEAIIVKDENLDPRTSRGTVSTPRNPSV